MENNSLQLRRNPIRACHVRAVNTMDSILQLRRNPVRADRLRNSREGGVQVVQDVRVVLEHLPCPLHPGRQRGSARTAARSMHQSTQPRTSDTPPEVQGAPQPSRTRPSSQRRGQAVPTKSNPQQHNSRGAPHRQTRSSTPNTPAHHPPRPLPRLLPLP